MNNCIVWLWCFPQNLVGLIVRLVTKARKVGNHFEYNVDYGNVSLGNYIFLCPANWHDDMTLKHEQGHQKQSLFLGWFYLLAIGLPSFVWASCFARCREKHDISYYWFYTEKWADRLGGVDRTYKKE